MSDTQIPAPPPPPSSRKRLLGASVAALAGAGLLLVAFVLPAEYGIDPTGVGKVFGLTDLGKMKEVKEADSAAAESASDVVEQTADGTHVRIVIRPYGGREVKGWLKAGAEMPYQWSSDSGVVEYDFHGEPKDGGAAKAVSFEIGKKASGQGVFKAPFEGLHGWFWKNLTAKPIIIDVTVKGPVERFEPLTKQGPVSMQGAAATDTSVPFYTGMSMKTLMADMIQPAAHGVWDRAGYISDLQGTRSLFPQTEKEWKEMENSSLLLAELTNDLLVPGRRVPEPEWDKAVVAVRTAALKTAAVVKRRNEDEVLEVSVEISAACESCHQRYAPNMTVPL